jgi:hypothetical protein
VLAVIEVTIVMAIIWVPVILIARFLIKEKRQNRAKAREERLAKDRARQEFVKGQERQKRLAARPVLDCRVGLQHDTDAACVRHDWSTPPSFVKVVQVEKGDRFNINLRTSYCARCGFRESEEVYKPY